MRWSFEDRKVEDVNVMIETEMTPIRHLAIQCPKCKNWFIGDDITEDHISHVEYIRGSNCECPKCEHLFSISYISNIDDSAEFPEFYKNCLQKKVSWE